MEPADGIRRLGFARWYERHLIEGHAWLVTGFACLIVVGACIEELGFRGSTGRLLLYVAVVAAAAAVGAYGLARYLRTLAEALRLGEHATCRSCGSYARFRMISAAEVRCTQCGHQWRLIHRNERD